MLRRQFCKALLTAPAALAAPALRRSALAQEPTRITLMMQHGLPYLPLMVMEANKLVEAHAAKLGLPALKAQYAQLGGTSSLVDALLAGSVNFAVTGVPGLATLWAKTAGTPQEVQALCAVQSMPFYLVTNNAAVKSLSDFTDKDKIALPSVKVSSQAVCLQMAAAQQWGMDKFDKLDAITITRPHPDATASVITGSTEVNSHYSAAPFYYYELAAAGVHSVLKSYDTLGGHSTNGVMLMSKTFGEANPKIRAAVFGALQDANALINTQPRQAAEIYIAATKEKRAGPDEMAKMIADADNVWTPTPQNAMKFIEFMHKTGSIKKLPASWKDVFMAETHGLPGT